MPKNNNKYKSGNSPENDEQKMPSRFKELVDSESGPQVGDPLHYVVDVETELEIPEGRVKAFTAANRPDAVTTQQISAMEHIGILYSYVEELRQENVELRSSFGREMASTRVDKLILLLGQYGRDVEAGSMRRLRQRCPGLRNLGVTRIYEVELLIEGQYYQADVRPVEIDNLDELTTEFNGDPAIQSLVQILNTPDFRNFYQDRNRVAHPDFEDHQEIERLMEEINGLPISERDHERFELACQFYSELIQVPGHRELVRLA